MFASICLVMCMSVLARIHVLCARQVGHVGIRTGRRSRAVRRAGVCQWECVDVREQTVGHSKR